MSMTKKQHKALERHKRIAKKRNIRTNNLPDWKKPALLTVVQGRPQCGYRLWNI